LTSAELKTKGCNEHPWTPGADFLAAIEALRDPRDYYRVKRASEAFEKCRVANDFCVYGLALVEQARGDVPHFRDLAAAYLQSNGASCAECRVIALRDLGVSLILQEPTDFAKGQEELLEACAFAADAANHWLIVLPGHIHPCSLIASRTPTSMKYRKIVELSEYSCADMLSHSCEWIVRNEPHIDLVWW
jgi:hypothetical protein